jgi:hypothetical protein
MRGFKEGETMKGKALLHLQDRKNRWKLVKTGRTSNFKCTDAMTKARDQRRDSACDVTDLKRKIVSARFVPQVLTPDQKQQCAASTAKYVEMDHDDRKALQRAMKVGISFMYDPETKVKCNLVEPRETEGSN